MNDLTFLDIINIISLILGVENFKLNDQQSKQMMKEMSENQDGMLRTIIKQNEILIAQNNKLLEYLKVK